MSAVDALVLYGLEQLNSGLMRLATLAHDWPVP